MTDIYQNIIVGINEVGRSLLEQSGRTFHYHDFLLPDLYSIKIWIKVKENEIDFHPVVCHKGKGFFSPTMPLPVRDREDEKREAGSGGELKRDSGDEKDNISLQVNRREYMELFCRNYYRLAEVIQKEEERIRTEDISRRLSGAGYKIKGKKVYVVGDMGDLASSALVLPLFSALKYLLRDERIPPVDWNFLGVINLREEPLSKVFSYSLLKEISTVKNINNARGGGEPVKMTLSMSPLDREVELWAGFGIWLSDARAYGVSPLSVEEICQIIARFIYFMTPGWGENESMSQDVLFFNSFGIGEFIFPEEEIQNIIARQDIKDLIKLFKNQKETPPDEQILKNGLSLIEGWDKQEPFSINKMEWKDFNPGISPSPGEPEDLIQYLKDQFENEIKYKEKKIQQIMGDSPLLHPFYKNISDYADILLNNYFYGYSVTIHLLKRVSVKINSFMDLIKTKIPPPPDDPSLQTIEAEIKDAVDSDSPLPVMGLAFLFAIIPFSVFIYNFLNCFYPGPSHIYKVLIILFSFILSAGGAVAQKKLIADSKKEKIDNYIHLMNKKYEYIYYNKLCETTQKFLTQLLWLIIGLNPTQRQKIDPSLLEITPLKQKVEDYFALLSDQNFDPEIKSCRFYASSVIVDPSSEEEMKRFSSDFLNRSLSLAQQREFPQTCPHLFDDIRRGIPQWREILENPHRVGEFYDIIYTNLCRNIRDNMNSQGVNLWRVIEKMKEDYFNRFASHLERLSSPLIRIKDHCLIDEERLMREGKILFISKKVSNMASLDKWAKKRTFSVETGDFPPDFLLFFQYIKNIQIYKLSYLEDWKYFENKLSGEDKKILYINDIFVFSDDIYYLAPS